LHGNTALQILIKKSFSHINVSSLNRATALEEPNEMTLR